MMGSSHHVIEMATEMHIIKTQSILFQKYFCTKIHLLIPHFFHKLSEVLPSLHLVCARLLKETRGWPRGACS